MDPHPMLILMKSQNLKMSQGPYKDQVPHLEKGIKNKKEFRKQKNPLVNKVLECVNTLSQVLFPLGKIGNI